MNLPIYLDYASTTPVDPAVADKMMQFLTPTGQFGNPASRSHVFGWQAEAAVEDARTDVATLIGADPREIVWTSGATEANNLAIKGCAHFNQRKGKHVITSKIEHKAVLDTCRQLEREGWEVTYLEPDSNGLIQPQMVADAIREDTTVVSIMHVNNELGPLNDIAAIGAICREKKVFFHVDAAQSAGKTAIDVESMNVDMMSFSAHKIYGPKGIGALYINGKTMGRIAPIIKGGGQERGIRPGTLPTHQIIGMAAAFRLAKQHMNNDLNHIRKCRALFLKSISHIKDAVVNTDEVSTFPGIISLCLPDLDAESIIFGMNTIALSKGSACTSDSDEPSHVLKSMGLSQEEIRGTIRISFGRYTTMNEVSIAAESLVKIVTHLKMIRGQ